MLDVRGVEHILVMPSRYCGVAILAIPPIVRILAILAADAIIVLHRDCGDFLKNLFALFEKRAAGIIVLPILQRVPRVRPPAFYAIDRKFRLGRIQRNYILFAKIARPPVVVAVITP
jgi:hypothetical protein